MTDRPIPAGHAGHDHDARRVARRPFARSLRAGGRRGTRRLVHRVRRPPRRPPDAPRRRPGHCRPRVRPRDYRADARSTPRASGAAAGDGSWRLGSRGTSFSRPLAVGLTTLGLAGLLRRLGPSMVQFGGSAAVTLSTVGDRVGDVPQPEVGTDSNGAPGAAGSPASCRRPDRRGRRRRPSRQPSRRPRRRSRQTPARPRAPVASAPGQDAFGPVQGAGGAAAPPSAADFGIKGAPSRAADLDAGAADNGCLECPDPARRIGPVPRGRSGTVRDPLERAPPRRRLTDAACPSREHDPVDTLTAGSPRAPTHGRGYTSSVPTERLMLLDGNGLIYRGYFALPPLTTSKGELVNAVFGFCEHRPPRASRTSSPTTSRSRSTSRARPSATSSTPSTRRPASACPTTCATSSRRSARWSRRCASPSTRWPATRRTTSSGRSPWHAERRGLETTIVTGDLDMLQLVTDHTRLMTTRSGVENTILYDLARIDERFDLRARPDDRLQGAQGRPDRQHPGRARGRREDRGQAHPRVRDARGAVRADRRGQAGQAARQARRAPRIRCSWARTSRRSSATCRSSSTSRRRGSATTTARPSSGCSASTSSAR